MVFAGGSDFLALGIWWVMLFWSLNEVTCFRHGGGGQGTVKARGVTRLLSASACSLLTAYPSHVLEASPEGLVPRSSRRLNPGPLPAFPGPLCEGQG